MLNSKTLKGLSEYELMLIDESLAMGIYDCGMDEVYDVKLVRDGLGLGLESPENGIRYRLGGFLTNWVPNDTGLITLMKMEALKNERS